MAEHHQHIQHVPAPPARPAAGHKGTFGTVLIVGGSPAMPAAPALCAAAALRCGSGLVKIAAQPEVLPHAITIEPGATGLPLSGTPADRAGAIEHADPGGRAVLAVGPGLGLRASAAALLWRLLSQRRPIVLDADGLNALAWRGQVRPEGGPALVLTPHPGEFRRLAQPLGIDQDPTDPATRPEAATCLARAHKAVVVLKGKGSVVTDGQRVFVNDTGSPAMGTAGSGDVLTGAIASLIGQGMTPFDAAVLGVHAHGLAGQQWAEEHGPSGMKAHELADAMQKALQTLRQER